MAENTKTPPNQDQRQRTPQGDAGKPQKPGGSVPTSNPADRSRQGMNNPNKPEIDPDRSRQGMNNPNKPEIDPDRDRQSRGKPAQPGKDGVLDDVDDVEDIDDDATQRMDRE